MDRTYNTMSDPAYEPLVDQTEDAPTGAEHPPRTWKRFSRFEYGIFFLLGVAMLWAWNMFLAAAPYFHDRFESSKWTATHYQSSILTVSTITNLAAAYTLATVQKNVSYPWRVIVSLLMNCVIFTLLAFSTVVLKDIPVRGYFGFLLIMVFGASLATGMNQNGVFAFAAGFGRDEYTQAIMGGQGLSGVLPCIAQIVSVVVVPRGEARHGTPASSPTSAFIYFMTATVVSVGTLLAFLYLLRTRPDMRHRSADSDEDENLGDHDHGHAHNKPVGLWTLFKKLKFLALGVFLCFTITMMSFPVYTGEIMSVNDPFKSRLYDAPVFVPLAFLFWNVGDLIGRLAVAIPRLSLANRPWAAFVLSIARAGFIPLYLFCNVNGDGAVVESDFFYLFVVQFLFGVTNGYLASTCMTGASHWVAVHEREAAGGFMNMMLVGGLAAGSVLSFIVAS